MRSARALDKAGRASDVRPMKGPMLVLLAVALAGCTAPDGPVTLLTHPMLTVCPAARVSGTLIADASYGLAYKNGSEVQGVIWPHGYSARRESGVVVLIDASGRTVAREGDHIVSAGSYGADGTAMPCGDLEVTSGGT